MLLRICGNSRLWIDQTQFARAVYDRGQHLARRFSYAYYQPAKPAHQRNRKITPA